MFVYGAAVGQVQTTSPTPNTELLGMGFLTDNSTPERNVGIMGLYVHGRGAGLTAISGIAFRVKQMTLANSSESGTVFLNPRDPGASTTLVSGGFGGTPNGSATLKLVIGCGAAGASGWFASSVDAIIQCNMAIGSPLAALDVFNASGSASMNYEESAELATV